MLGIQRFGGFARQVHVPHERYLVDTTGLDEPWAATLACSGLTSYSAVSKVLPLDPEDWVAVIGTGGVGLMAVAVLKALGHRAIAVIDVNGERLELAVGMGARIAINSAAGLASEDVVTRLGGPVIAAVDFVNSGQTADLAFGALAKGGTLVSVGLFGGEVTIPTALVAIKCLTIRGSFVGTLAELEELIALARRGGLPQTPVIGGDLGADALNAALEALAAGTVRGRIVLSQLSSPTPAPVGGPHARNQSPTTEEV
jgi:D-arabinose 1-dehydrogenase-like Zn-dependent alcohol dehydrogenase